MPVPLQVALVCIPAVHWLVQLVPEGQSAQAPAVHVPSVPQVVSAVTTQMPRGSLSPLVTFTHLPFMLPVSAAEQAWQAVLHAELQQKPSTQKPSAHWLAALHVAPGIPFCVHTPEPHQ